LYCVAALQVLLALGAPVNCVDAAGLTPLYLSVSSQAGTDPDVVEMLLKDFAQQGVRDVSGSTEIHQVP